MVSDREEWSGLFIGGVALLTAISEVIRIRGCPRASVWFSCSVLGCRHRAPAAKRQYRQPERTMLEGLDAVDWGSVEHAYGPATDVPDLLRALRSDSFEDRRSAFDALFANIIHQGTVYDATALAVPFIIELLNAPDVLDTESLALLLASIAEGRGYLEVHIQFRDRAFWERLLAKKGTNVVAQLERERETVKRVRRAVQPGLDLLLPFLSKGSSDTRVAVASGLAKFPERAGELVPALEAALATEKDGEVRAQIAESVQVLRVGKREDP
jgi:hypothetical protein